MSEETYRCSGCDRTFVRRGFLNHIQLSRDPRCTAAWDRLQPTYPITHDQETPPSLEIDVEMSDVHSTHSTDKDIEMSDSEDDDTQSEAADFITPPLGSHTSIVFDSDEEDSDDDGDEEQILQLEGETLLSPRSMPDTETEHVVTDTERVTPEIERATPEIEHVAPETEHVAPETERTAPEAEQMAQAGKFLYIALVSSFDQIY
jgi:hypothetical protein